jgi:LysR family transcriptional regulator, benzoate and cis,cis-muconate-responsive activator of ben and cat genes
MELRHLRYFVAIADEQHVGRAAARLHVSPSPLSRQLGELEQELGVKLLERVGRGIRTSDAGTAFAADARRILADVDRAVSKLGAAQRGEIGHLAIGFVESPSFAPLIPVVIGAFRRRHPAVTIELQPLALDELRASLRTRRIRAALTLSLVDPEPEVHSQLLFAEPVVLALPRSHPLADRNRLRAQDLHDQPFVWSARPERVPILDGLWALLHARGVAPRVVVESRSTATRLSLVASGVGMTFCAESWSRPRQVVTKLVSDLKVEAKGYLAWRPEDDSWPLLRSLSEIIRDVLPGVAKVRRRGVA